MPAPLVWSPGSDHALARLRAERRSWDTIARALGVSRWAAIERAKAIGAHAPRHPQDRPAPRAEPGREPLPAGHPVAWAVLTEGTLLAATPYPYPPMPVPQ